MQPEVCLHVQRNSKKKNKPGIPAAETLLQSCRRGILAVNGDNGCPYAIPVNCFYDRDSQKIRFHRFPAGHKADALQACGKVCFPVYGNETVRTEAWAPFVQSVIVFGLCHREQIYQDDFFNFSKLNKEKSF